VEYLESVEDASAAMADALRARMDRGAAMLAVLRAMGFDITDEGLERARGALPPMTAELKDEIKRRRDMLRAGTWPTDETAA
jgi:hypothetical protein